MTQPTVFISYSHKDEAEKNALLTHLGVLQSHGLIELWNDDRILAGDDWAGEISDAMAGAKVAILLVTANFLTSNFILSQELPTLLKRRRDEGITVFPVIAKPCAWTNVKWLTNMNVRPKNGTPVWRDGGIYVDEELSKIAMEVAAILERAATKPTPPPAPGLDLAELTASRTSTSTPSSSGQAGSQPLTSFQQQRLADLQRHLEQDYELLQEYEDLVRSEDDPRHLMRYRREIERQKAAIAGYQQQLTDILPDAATRSQATPDQIQQTLTALQAQIATLEARLLSDNQ